jgi:hypothetical protein
MYHIWDDVTSSMTHATFLTVKAAAPSGGAVVGSSGSTTTTGTTPAGNTGTGNGGMNGMDPNDPCAGM